MTRCPRSDTPTSKAKISSISEDVENRNHAFDFMPYHRRSGFEGNWVSVGAALRGRPGVGLIQFLYKRFAHANTGCPRSDTPTGRPR